VVTAVSQRGKATEAAQASSFESPFSKTAEGSSTYKIPKFTKYASPNPATNNKVFSYFMAGTLGMLSAVGAKATVHGQSLTSSPRVAVGFFGWLVDSPSN
jgi:ubiquinol-cytochrome c reductase iron-sulfur subunit